MNNSLKELLSIYSFKDLIYKENPFLALFHKFTFKNNKLYYSDKIILELL